MTLKNQVIFALIFALALGGALRVASRQPEAPAAEATLDSMQFVQVADASWGLNCNFYISELRERSKISEWPKLPVEIRRSNALRAVSRLCNGKDACAFEVTPTSLGPDPVANCRKELEVKYRCTLTGLPAIVTAQDNDPLVIDCRQPQSEASEASPAAHG